MTVSVAFEAILLFRVLFVLTSAVACRSFQSPSRRFFYLGIFNSGGTATLVSKFQSPSRRFFYLGLSIVNIKQKGDKVAALSPFSP